MLESTYELVKIRTNEPERYETSVRQAFLREIIKNLGNRFLQVDVLEAFSIFDPQGLLGQEGIAVEKLEILLNHYNSLTEDSAAGQKRLYSRVHVFCFVPKGPCNP